MPIAILAALGEVTTILSTLAAGAETVFAFIGQRWWLAAIADLVVRRATDNKFVFPRTLEHAVSLSGQALFEELTNHFKHSNAAPILREVGSYWETRAIMAQAAADGAFSVDVATAATIICQDIPPDMTLPQWIAKVRKETGYSEDRILALRTSFKEINNV